MQLSLYTQLKDMLATLKEAVEYIQHAEDKALCLELCANGQALTAAVQKAILENQSSIKDDRLVGQLESCKSEIEDLVRVLKEGTGQQSSAGSLLEQINKIQAIFKEDVQIMYRVVFFAELGQKWDSMESVYKAFKDREDCEVKVVLTPIFRAVQTADGTKTEILYEDYLTSLGVDHIPYDKYDLKKDLPDMAFISNPYESVTLPKFWPENIAKYTRLVYLPYYTGMLINDKSIQAHCGMPVARYAWKIIAQSEKIKDIHKKFAPRKGENILVTGLPKWDSIAILNEKEIRLDSDWKRQLTDKKVFLWNSHYNIDAPFSTFFEYGKALIDLFANKQDIALIWRPHPMMDTIFKLYHSEHLPMWEEMKNIVLNADNMILDDHQSYEMAFNCSDALISDWSSLITQYLLTQKPVIMLRSPKHTIDAHDSLIRYEDLDQAKSLSDIEAFIYDIKNGIDRNKEKRLSIIKENLSGADGRIGEKVCDMLIEELKKALG